MIEPSLAGKNVLLVEDEMLVLMAVEDAFVELGCTSIAVAPSVPAALALIEANSFDLALLDLNLDGTYSYPVAEALQSRGVAFAFATGCGAHNIDARFEARPLLRKPYGSAQLKQVIAELLSAKEPVAAIS